MGERLMIEEIIKKDASIKIFPVGRDTGMISDFESRKPGRGIIRKFVSETEIEVELQEEISLDKMSCYAIYILSYEKVYLTYVYYRSSFVANGSNMVSLEIVSPMERVQRRMHQRVSCHARLSFRRVSEESIQGDLPQKKSLAETDSPEHEDSMVDISGGGIRFTTKEDVRQDEYLQVLFDIEHEGCKVAMSVFGQVVSAGKLRNEKDFYDVRMRYVGISEKQKEQIIHYVFQLERNE